MSSVDFTEEEYTLLKTISLKQYFDVKHPDRLLATRYPGRYNVYVMHDKEVHTSLEIKDNGHWSFYSKGLWGKTAFDWLCRVEHMSFNMAGEELGFQPGFTEEDFKKLYGAGQAVLTSASATEVPKSFKEPVRYGSNAAAVKYLKSRGISPDVIDFCLKQGYIYTEAGNYLNIVFAGYDEYGYMAYAAKRGLTDGPIIGLKRKIMDLLGTAKIAEAVPKYVSDKFGIKWPETAIPDTEVHNPDAAPKADVNTVITLMEQNPDNDELCSFLADIKKILITPKAFKRDAPGSDKNYAFGLYNKTRKSVHFFEGAMDVLGYCSCLIDNGFDFRFENLKSCGGIGGSEAQMLNTNSPESLMLPPAIEGYLKNNTVQTVYLHFDNDKAGRAATTKISYALKQRGYAVFDIPAPQIPGHYIKDWGDYAEVLQTMKSKDQTLVPAVKTAETPTPVERS